MEHKAKQWENCSCLAEVVTLHECHPSSTVLRDWQDPPRPCRDFWFARYHSSVVLVLSEILSEAQLTYMARKYYLQGLVVQYMQGDSFKLYVILK